MKTMWMAVRGGEIVELFWEPGEGVKSRKPMWKGDVAMFEASQWSKDGGGWLENEIVIIFQPFYWYGWQRIFVLLWSRNFSLILVCCFENTEGTQIEDLRHLQSSCKVAFLFFSLPMSFLMVHLSINKCSVTEYTVLQNSFCWNYLQVERQRIQARQKVL